MATPLIARKSFIGTNDNALHYQHGVQIEIVKSINPVAGEAKRTIRVSTPGTVIDNTKVCGDPSAFFGGIDQISVEQTKPDEVRVFNSYSCSAQVIDEVGSSDRWTVRDFSPQTLNKQTQITTSTSIGVDFGLFGGTPTAGVSMSSSSSTGWTLTDYELSAAAGRPVTTARENSTAGPYASWEIYRDPKVLLPEISFGAMQPTLEAVYALDGEATSRYTRIATAATTQYDIIKTSEGTIGNLIDKIPDWGLSGVCKSLARSVMRLLVPDTDVVDILKNAVPDTDFEPQIYGQVFEIDWATGSIYPVPIHDDGAEGFALLRREPTEIEMLTTPRDASSDERQGGVTAVDSNVDRVAMRYWPGSDSLVGFLSSQDQEASNTQVRTTELSLPDAAVPVENLIMATKGERFAPVMEPRAWPFRGSLAVDTPASECGIWVVEPNADRGDFQFMVGGKYSKEPIDIMPEAPQGIDGDLENTITAIWRDHLIAFHQFALVSALPLRRISRVAAAAKVEGGWLALSDARLYFSTDAFMGDAHDISETAIDSSKHTLRDLLREAYDPTQDCGMVGDGKTALLFSGEKVLKITTPKGFKPGDTGTLDASVSNRRSSLPSLSPLSGAAAATSPDEGVPVGSIKALSTRAIYVRATIR